MEEMALYVSREDAEYVITSNAIWIDPTRDGALAIEDLNGRYLLVEGVFVARRRGHGGVFSGALVDVCRLSPIARRELLPWERRE